MANKNTFKIEQNNKTIHITRWSIAYITFPEGTHNEDVFDMVLTTGEKFTHKADLQVFIAWLNQ